MVFARGGEELAELLEAGCEVEVVPGLSSALAAPELAGIPLTFRGVARSFAIVTGHGKDGMLQDWSAYGRVDTLIILMGVRKRVAIATELLRVGRPAAEPVAFIERASTPTERRVFSTLGQVAAGDSRSPETAPEFPAVPCGDNPAPPYPRLALPHRKPRKVL